MLTGYENIYLNLLPRLAACDFVENAERLGLETTGEGHVLIPFLGRAYRITREGAKPEDNLPADVNTLSVLLYYVFSEGSGEPKQKYVPFFRLTGVLEGQWGQTRDVMRDPLIREFGGDYGKFVRAAERLGGKCESETVGRHDWLFLLLPKIPAQVVYYEADEEFPAEIQILLDETAPRFLEFECLAFLVGCFVNTMIKIGQGGA